MLDLAEALLQTPLGLPTLARDRLRQLCASMGTGAAARVGRRRRSEPLRNAVDERLPLDLLTCGIACLPRKPGKPAGIVEQRADRGRQLTDLVDDHRAVRLVEPDRKRIGRERDRNAAHGTCLVRDSCVAFNARWPDEDPRTRHALQDLIVGDLIDQVDRVGLELFNHVADEGGPAIGEQTDGIHTLLGRLWKRPR